MTQTLGTALMAATLASVFVVFFALVMGLAVWSRRVRSARAEAQAQANGSALGFSPSEAELSRPNAHWVGTFEGHPAVIGYYDGSRNVGATSGVLLMLQAGSPSGGIWSANLSSRPPRLAGRGDRREVVERALTDEVLSRSEGLPEASLVPGEGLLEGNVLHDVVTHHWPEGWVGLHVRAVLPRQADAFAIGSAFAQMAQVAAALPSRDDPSE